MKLYFVNAIGKETLVAEVASEEEALDELYEHCTQREVYVHYLRTWTPKETNRRMYDFGSHTEFYALELN